MKPNLGLFITRLLKSNKTNKEQFSCSQIALGFWKGFGRVFLAVESQSLEEMCDYQNNGCKRDEILFFGGGGG